MNQPPMPPNPYARAAAWQPKATEAHSKKFAHTERHLQCAWFDDAVRPAELRTAQGVRVIVEQAGHWNLEHGPDFIDATLRLEPGGQRLRGDIEIHIQPGDWQRHGHASDPAYARVIAHVSYYPNYLPAARLPPGCIQIALRDALEKDPCFAFDNLDITAYPYAQRSPQTPCARLLGDWHPDTISALLEAAGAARLERKAQRLGPAMTNPDQVFYEEFMSALGYKYNQGAMRAVAKRLPLVALRELSGRQVILAYALLLGVAGLLPRQTPARWDAPTRSFVRQLWNSWWKHQDQWGSSALEPRHWKLNGLRPANHPRRRLMAAACLFTQTSMPSQKLLSFPSEPAAKWLQAVGAWLQSQAHTYWEYRLTWGGRRQKTAVALIGPGRRAAILTNVILPFLTALSAAAAQPPKVQGKPAPLWRGAALRRQLPPEEDNSIIRQTAHLLLGQDHNPKLYQSGLRQQGLLHIFYDFCLTDRSRCAACPLPAYLTSLTAGSLRRPARAAKPQKPAPQTEPFN